MMEFDSFVSLPPTNHHKNKPLQKSANNIQYKQGEIAYCGYLVYAFLAMLVMEEHCYVLRCSQVHLTAS